MYPAKSAPGFVFSEPDVAAQVRFAFEAEALQ